MGTTIKQKQKMENKTRLFGTDGIRGQVGQFPLDDASLVRLGSALAASASGAKIVPPDSPLLPPHQVDPPLVKSLAVELFLHRD